jgi:two-component system, NarL family, response regulator NreC
MVNRNPGATQPGATK